MIILSHFIYVFHRDLGSQASMLTALPQQLSSFPPRILEATILPAVGRICSYQNSLWVYALPLHVYIAERISNQGYQRVAGPSIVEGLAVTHPPETMLAFVRHVNLLQDKFDIEFFRVHVVRMLCNCVDKAHPPLQVIITIFKIPLIAYFFVPFLYYIFTLYISVLYRLRH